MEKFVCTKLSMSRSDIDRRRLPFTSPTVTDPAQVEFLVDIKDLLPLLADPPEVTATPTPTEKVSWMVQLFDDPYAVLLIKRPPEVVKQLWRDPPSILRVSRPSGVVND